MDRDMERRTDDETPGVRLPAGRSGTPDGMTRDDVEARAALAQALGKEVWPADREALLLKAAASGASEEVIARIGRLPDGETFENVQDVAVSLGIGVEQHRS